MEIKEIDLIRKTWKIPMTDPIAFGGTIYIEFFSQYPHNQLKFTKFQNIPANELIASGRFRLHAKRIIQVFDDSIQSLGYDWSLQKLKEIWYAIAEDHVKRNIAKQSYYQLKESTFIALDKTCKFNEDEAAAWQKFLNYLYGFIFEKYEELQTANKKGE